MVKDGTICIYYTRLASLPVQAPDDRTMSSVSSIFGNLATIPPNISNCLMEMSPVKG